MENILTAHQISASIVDIIERAKDYCFLITPYYRPWELLSRALEKASKKEKKVFFILREDANSKDTINYLNKELGFDVVLVERLHTKLYLNESEALITSMNLYDSSKEFNYELGYLLTGFQNIKKLKEHIIEDDLLSSNSNIVYKGRYIKAVDVKNEENQKEITKTTKNVPVENKGRSYFMGYCIRCKKSLEINRNYPLCNDCYSIWSQFMNGDYEERYCHRCGNESKVSKNKPFCIKCDRALQM